MRPRVLRPRKHDGRVRPGNYGCEVKLDGCLGERWVCGSRMGKCGRDHDVCRREIMVAYSSLPTEDGEPSPAFRAEKVAVRCWSIAFAIRTSADRRSSFPV